MFLDTTAKLRSTWTNYIIKICDKNRKKWYHWREEFFKSPHCFLFSAVSPKNHVGPQERRGCQKCPKSTLFLICKMIFHIILFLNFDVRKDLIIAQKGCIDPVFSTTHFKLYTNTIQKGFILPLTLNFMDDPFIMYCRKLCQEHI